MGEKGGEVKLRHKCVVWVWVATVAAMGLYPPWIYATSSSSVWDEIVNGPSPKGSIRVERVAYAFLFDSTTIGRIDTSRLLLEWFIATIVAAGVYLALVPPASKSPS
jgi:hypothetical protein